MGQICTLDNLNALKQNNQDNKYDGIEHESNRKRFLFLAVASLLRLATLCGFLRFLPWDRALRFKGPSAISDGGRAFVAPQGVRVKVECSNLSRLTPLEPKYV